MSPKKKSLIILNPVRNPSGWPEESESISREAVKSVMAWYFLKAALGQENFLHYDKSPREECPLQRAAKHEAEIYFDVMLDRGAWKPRLAWKLTKYRFAIWGLTPVKYGWPEVVLGRGGINRMAARFISCALGGGKAAGQKVFGVAKELEVPPWTISRQLRDAVCAAGYDAVR